MKKNNIEILSPFLLLGASFIWGFAFAAQKSAAVLRPFTVTAIRNLIGSLFLIPVIALFDKISGNGRKIISKRGIDFTKEELLYGFFCGLVLFVASATQQIGIEETDAGKTAFITALYVVIVPLYSLLLGKKQRYNIWLGVVIAMLGFYLLCIKSGFTIVRGDLIVLACAFMFGVQIMVVGHFSPKVDCVRLSCVQFFVVFLLATPFSLIMETPYSGEALISAIPSLLFLGVLSSGCAYTLQVLGQKHTQPAVASILMSLESVFGAIGGAIILHEVMTAREYIGCAVVFLGVVVAQTDPILLLRRLIGKKASDSENAQSLK